MKLFVEKYRAITTILVPYSDLHAQIDDMKALVNDRLREPQCLIWQGWGLSLLRLRLIFDN